MARLCKNCIYYRPPTPTESNPEGHCYGWPPQLHSQPSVWMTPRVGDDRPGCSLHSYKGTLSMPNMRDLPGIGPVVLTGLSQEEQQELSDLCQEMDQLPQQSMEALPGETYEEWKARTGQ